MWRLLVRSQGTLETRFVDRRCASSLKYSRRRKFVDRARLAISSGNGGDGCVSFDRTKNRRVGKPNGGNGARGGDIVVEATASTRGITLTSSHFRAKSGGHGQRQGKAGKSAKDVVIQVPVGTVISQLDTHALSSRVQPSDWDKAVQLEDLTTIGQRVVIAKGGAGGRGNSLFASSTNRSPHMKEAGQLGATKRLQLELKLLADIGLVGFPNAGKSTLLGSISAATPKVASYPFTTLHPFVGHVRLSSDDAYTVVDLPGLIRGASENRGLGHAFLRHVERTRVILYVLDSSEPPEVVEENLRVLLDEVEAYSPGLSLAHSALLASKTDCAAEGSVTQVQMLAQELGVQSLEVSAIEGDVDDFRFQLHRLLEKMTPAPPVDVELIPSDME